MSKSDCYESLVMDYNEKISANWSELRIEKYIDRNYECQLVDMFYECIDEYEKNGAVLRRV